MFKNLLFCTLVLFLTNLTLGQAPLPEVYPKIQHLEIKGESFPINGFYLAQGKWDQLVKQTPIGERLTSKRENGLRIDIQIQKTTKAQQAQNNLAQAEGAYDLSITEKGISISATEERGVFYALQTLAQLIDDHHLTPVEIMDYPSMTYRGVVEGFYGTPWTTEARISQLIFYGKYKANTYIYGPKDDPYHSSPHWRDPYPGDQADHIRELVGIANANFVDFVWAIHPGKDIQWNDEDRQNVLNKFEHMYDLGVRSFALFFDDISGEGTKATMQAGLLNFLTEEFVEKKSDVKPLIITPTDYNKSWAGTGPDSYLNVLGRELHPSVQIMWTGDYVVADIDKSTLDWVQERIQRPALVWWNFPVSDYVRNHLLLGPSYGLEKGVDVTEMSGILSNPMEHAEASKVGIFGVADYSWNTDEYDSQRSWEKAIEAIVPNAYPAYALFSENNADPDKNWHGYRRDESVTIAPKIEKLKADIENGKDNPEFLESVKNYFYKISTAAEKIEKANDNPALIREIKPWLDRFTRLGKEGLTQLDNYEIQSFSAEALWNSMLTHYNETAGLPQAKLENEPNIIPVTSTLVLQPFVEFLQDYNNRTLIEKITGQEDFTKNNPGIGSVATDIDDLSEVKLLAGPDQKIMLQPVLEVFEIKPKQKFTISLSQSQTNSEIKSAFESDSHNWMKIELSEDGENWFAPSQMEEKDKKINATTNATYKFVRATNDTDQSVHLRLNQFIVQNKDENAGGNAMFIHDLDVFTAMELKRDQTLVEKSEMTDPKEVIILADTKGAKLEVKTTGDQGSGTDLGTFTGNFIRVTLPSKTQSVTIETSQDVDIYEILWR